MAPIRAGPPRRTSSYLQRTPLHPKKGLISLPEFTPAMLAKFNSTVSWFYNYRLRPSHAELEWANANGIEFVPMLYQEAVLLGDADVEAQQRPRCFLTAEALAVRTQALDPVPFAVAGVCEVSHLLSELQALRDELAVAPRYLMTANEPYPGEDAPNPPRYIPVRRYVTAWRNLIQPAAAAANLSLLSPSIHYAGVEQVRPDSPGVRVVLRDPHSNMSISEAEGEVTAIGWMATFLAHCYEQRDATPPCHIDSLVGFSVHQYTCDAMRWEKNYGRDGLMQSHLTSRLRGQGLMEMDAWIAERPFSVTETSCEDDCGEYGGVRLCPSQPDNPASCRRITGAYGDPASCSERADGKACLWGRGSLAFFDAAPSIERYAWWPGRSSCAQKRSAGGVMRPVASERVSSCESAGMFHEGGLTPVGRAYQAHGTNAMITCAP